jgi:small subunit ribosomal protein S8
MAINDPIGDLLARIRNGQLRGLAGLQPGFAARRRLLDVLKSRFIRSYARGRAEEQAETEIELKYRRQAGDPRLARSRRRPPRLPRGERINRGGLGI